VHGYWPEPFGLHGCDNPPCCNVQNSKHVHAGTALLNVQECAERGRARFVQQRPGEGNSLAKLTNAQVAKVRELYSAGALLRELATEFPLSLGQLSLIVRGLAYQEAGGPVVVGDQRVSRSGGSPGVRRIT
jgi:hypothetical protein